MKWGIALTSALLLVAGGIGYGGHLAVKSHRDSDALERANDAALAAAKSCVAATQPPDAAAVPRAQQTLIECSTGDFESQAAWYGAVLGQAYQAVGVHVQIPEMYAAVERINTDGSVLAIMAFSVTISRQGMQDRQNSYRVRVKMVRENGQFKVAELNQVAQ
ncbi:Mce protein [Mycolicibacterium sp.]|uniref:Mce protein n=1 Tax=Mycolicibacterium sp. TaxID=2320850 RepID=UPI0037CCB0CB